MVDKQSAIKQFISMFSLKNKIIIVTGASGLLGREHVKAILGAGGTPILLDLNQEVLNNTIEQFKNKNFNYNKLSLKYWINKINEYKNT